MQIVIDIPESIYKELKANEYLPYRLMIEKAITSGTVLPEKHGRLIDGDALEKRLNASAEYWLDTDSRLEMKFGKGIAEAADKTRDMDTIVEKQNGY